MIDHNWQSVDWQAQLEWYLSKLANPNTPPEWCMVWRKMAGRCILLMQEYLDQQDYEYILQACQFGPDMACTYREMYLQLVKLNTGRTA